MAIVVTCRNCQATFGAKEADAGRRGKCPNCKSELIVPEAGPSAPATITANLVEEPAQRRQPAVGAGSAAKSAPAGPPTARRVPAPAVSAGQAAQATAAGSTYNPASILNAFQGSIEPVRSAGGYRLAVVLVLGFMVLLPVFYVALIGLVCLLLGLHAVYDTALLHAGRGRGALLAVMLYSAPLLAGAILVFFMFKPLLARPMKQGKPRSLNREQEPLLFAFVDRVCEAVNAPAPSRIDVDCYVNASASFRRGMWSMLGNDLVLTLGLPLVAGLNTRQFAGVVAHEFGHFSQGAGMRLSYLVRTLSFWLTRVVYERDEWDERLVAWSQGLDIRIGIIFLFARLFVWLTRKTLWLLMMLGHLVSGILLRQMEYDADCYETRLVGSDVFESTMRRLILLDVATQGAFADLGEFSKEGRLSDDFPRLIVANAGQIGPQATKWVDERIDEESEGLFSTHPAPRDRIAHAHEEAAPGIFHVERPARDLFQNFAALSKTCTLDLYRSLFGKQVKLTDLHPVEQLLAKQEQFADDIKSLKRFFQNTFSLLRPLRLPQSSLTEGAPATHLVVELKRARQSMLQQLPEHQRLFTTYDQADTDWLEAEMADALFNARVKVKASDFKQSLTSPQQTLQARAAARGRLEQISGQLVPLEELAIRRLVLAMELAQRDEVAARLSTAQERLAECERIRTAAAVASAQVGVWLALRNRMAVLSTLLPRLSEARDNASLFGSVEKNIGLLVRQIRDFQNELSHVRYPFHHAKADPTLSEFLLPQAFNESDWSAVLSAGSAVVEGFPRLYARMFGRMTALAEEVEGLLGLPRQADPVESEEKTG
ncbi:MAG TPA: M48 family metalloprotease [Pirellulales bacterium]|nr:M48 family metalloprotease [Pirellulales bacterium]